MPKPLRSEKMLGGSHQRNSCIRGAATFCLRDEISLNLPTFEWTVNVDSGNCTICKQQMDDDGRKLRRMALGRIWEVFTAWSAWCMRFTAWTRCTTRALGTSLTAVHCARFSHAYFVCTVLRYEIGAYFHTNDVTIKMIQMKGLN